MTNEEFSNAFSTLLNSYNTQSSFGESHSKREIVLDEYEKSVFLTQAQDLVVKSYFEGMEGFDSSTRRQIDFSSLIKVAELNPTDSPYPTFDSRGIIYSMPKRGEGNNTTTDVLYILNEKLIERKCKRKQITPNWEVKAVETTPGVATYWWFKDDVNTNIMAAYPDSGEWELNNNNGVYEWNLVVNDTVTNTIEATEEEKPAEFVTKEYVIVPINYKEYDREMSKPYSQPLKKQAWRLFQNNSTGFDVNSELIPKFSIKVVTSSPNEGESILKYKVRYVRRPNPIILENLPSDLSIEGISTETPCELNPILHMDILTRAFELALTTRGQAPQQQTREKAND